MNAVFEVAGQSVETSPSAAGPWDQSFQHGAAPAALVAWAAERLQSDPSMRIVRLTLDLLRPVPVAPLEIRAEVLRQGRKIQVVSISLLAGGVAVVMANVLKVLQSNPPLPKGLGETELDCPLPDECEAISDEEAREFDRCPESLPEGRLRQTGDPRRASTGSERNSVPSQPADHWRTTDQSDDASRHRRGFRQWSVLGPGS